MKNKTITALAMLLTPALAIAQEAAKSINIARPFSIPTGITPPNLAFLSISTSALIIIFLTVIVLAILMYLSVRLFIYLIQKNITNNHITNNRIQQQNVKKLLIPIIALLIFDLAVFCCIDNEINVPGLAIISILVGLPTGAIGGYCGYLILYAIDSEKKLHLSKTYFIIKGIAWSSTMMFSMIPILLFISWLLS